MKVDVWSDIMCPFCYIGKRRLEGALKQFDHGSEIEVEWHSFQLDPAMKPQPGKSMYQYLAERKGQSLDWSVKVHRQMTENAKADGLEYNFDKAVIANSFDAHRVIHLAKRKGLGDAAKERIFRAYFTEGKDISDAATLEQLGSDAGLTAAEVRSMLESNDLTDSVNADIEQAQQLGINGVPFFVLDNKYAISGAQPAEVFLSGLKQAWGEYATDRADDGPAYGDGAVCTPGGDC